MLEDVGVQIPGVGRFVRQQRAAESHQLDLQTVLLFGHLLRHFRYILLGAVNHTDLNVLRFITLLVAADQRQTRQHYRGGGP
ncbi:Uncharacterised protein [Klebsiella pneumoniae]|nr:Uncharacterised protein [Klebsiella pneumoniae]